MSERARNSPGTPVAFNMGISAGHPDLLRGVDTHLYGGPSAGSPGFSPARRQYSDRNPRLGGRVYIGAGGLSGSPHWYRRLAIAASGTSGVAVLVIYLAQKGVIG